MTLTAREVLARWGASTHKVDVCDEATLDIPLTSRRFSDAADWCSIGPNFNENCRVLFPATAASMPGKITIRKLSPVVQTDVTIIVMKTTASISIGIGGPDARIFIGHFGYDFRAQINTWRNPLVCIGDKATCNGASIIADDADVILGRDCMLSDQVVLQSHAQHGIVDVSTMQLTNTGRHHLVLGEHVWIGRRSTVMPNVRIGKGSIVATGAVVTHDVPAFSVAAGVPAKIIRSGTSWSRDPVRIDKDAQKFFTGIQMERPRIDGVHHEE